MKKFYSVLTIIAVMMMFVGCDTQQHSSSSGTIVVALVWKGSLDAAPSNPKTNWAYYNTTDKKSYIYDGKSWQILAQDGTDGQDGKDGKDATSDIWTIEDDGYWYLNGVKTNYQSKGDKGDNGQDATSDVWRIGNDGYWYLNGEKSEYKSKGEDGHDGTNGFDGISIVWKGSLNVAPNNPELNWAYYNTSDKKSYIYDGTEWQILAQDGQDVTPDVHIPSYTIIFAANGGKGYMPKMVCEIGQTYDVPECEFTAPSGKDFKCWDLLGNVSTFSNLSTTDGDIIVATAQWENLPEYGLSLKGNIVLDHVEYPNTSFVKVMESQVTIDGTDDNWSSYLDSSASDYYKGAFINGRNVKLSPYSMGQYLVTQELYEAVMSSGRNYDKNSTDEGKHPAYYVSWYDAITFCNKLSLLMGKEPCYTVSGITDWAGLVYSSIPTSTDSTWNAAVCDITKNGYRLPTEAEWEFAARGGDQSKADWKYAFSGIDVASGNKIYDGSNYLTVDANLDTVGWYSNNSSDKVHSVGGKTANRLGLYDMSGNLYELCWDWYNATVTTNDTTYQDGEGVVINPLGATSGSSRVLRGGRWSHGAKCCCVSFSCNVGFPYRRCDYGGFRLACSVE